MLSSVTNNSVDNKQPESKSRYTLRHTAIALSMVAVTALSGCQSIKGVTEGLFNNNKSDTVLRSEKSEEGYYLSAIDDIDKGNYTRAASALKDLRTFYPTGRFAQQAMLDLIYVEFQLKNYDEAIAQANQFISLYPRNSQVDYAHYVRGVAHMTNANTSEFFINLDSSERDTAYYRLAFDNFAELINKYPNSKFAPDAAKRLTYIYNQFSAHELHTTRWYVEREAFVAAANRAKWVFQYYPKSESVPEAIAILAYSYDKLGMADLSSDYQTLLRINYPEWLDNNGNVKLSRGKKTGRSLVNRLSFGKLGRASNSSESIGQVGEYQGQTKAQQIYNASRLTLPTNSN